MLPHSDKGEPSILLPKFFTLLLIVLLPKSLIAQVNRTVQNSSIVFNHVTVIDVTGTPSKTDMTVIITGSQISAIGKTGKVRVPKNAQVVDASGKFLIPGLWDMHVHLQATTPFPLYIANGVLGVRHMGGNLKQVYEWREAVRQGKLLAPRIIACGSVVDDKDEPEDVIRALTAEEGRKAVTINKNQGADFIKVYDGVSREAYFALVEEAKRQRISFAGHVPIAVNSFEASNAGQTSFEHLTNILRSSSTLEPDVIEQTVKATFKPSGKPNDFSDIPARIAVRSKIELETFSEQKAQLLFALLVKNHTWQVPTLVVLKSRTYADDFAKTSDSRMKYITQEELEDWKPENNFFLKYRTPEYIEVRKREDKKDDELVGEMHKAGVQFMTGTDIPAAYLYTGFSLHDELALLVKDGFTPMEALQAATINPAKFLGLEKSLGTIEKGKLADLVLLEANPLENIANTKKISAVIVNGRYLSNESLQKMLADVEAIANKK
jgi:hypothetical protein